MKNRNFKGHNDAVLHRYVNPTGGRARETQTWPNIAKRYNVTKDASRRVANFHFDKDETWIEMIRAADTRFVSGDGRLSILVHGDASVRHCFRIRAGRLL